MLKPKKDDIAPTVLAEAMAETATGLDNLGHFHKARQVFGLYRIACWHLSRALIKAKAGADGGVDRVDWAAWRLSLECMTLYHRSGRRFGAPDNAISMTQLLHLALSRMILNQGAEAADLVRKTQGYLVKVATYATLCGRLSTGDLGVIGLLYRRLTGYTPDHPLFRHDETLLSPDGLARSMAARSRYAKPTVNLFCGYSFKLMPPEVIWLNSLLSEADQMPGLTGLARAMAATDMPDEPHLRFCDERLRAEGL